VGLGEFYTTNGQGKLDHLGGPHPEWRDSWTQIVPGNFGRTNPDFTDLLFYGRGELEFYTTDGNGGIKQQGPTIELPLPHSELTELTQIVPGNFGRTNFTDLLFYHPMP
jgi:hypothetical protein